MSINLTPDLEQAVSQEALRLGITPEGFVEQTLRQHLAERQQSNDAGDANPERRLQRLLSIVRPYGVAHTHDSLSSEGLYD